MKMDATVFEKFNNMFDIEGLKEDIANADNGDFEPVPHGDYEVCIDKLELGESKAGSPMVKVWFKIVVGEYKGQRIFMNQTVDAGFKIKIMERFLDSLESGIPVSFDGFVEYAILLENIYQAIQDDEYQLAYGSRTAKNGKDYDNYEIVQKFPRA